MENALEDSGNEAWPVAARGAGAAAGPGDSWSAAASSAAWPAAPPSSALFLLNSLTAAKSAFPAIKVEREPAVEPQSRVSAVSDMMSSMWLRSVSKASAAMALRAV